MLRHPAPGALTFMIYLETHTPTMTCGSKCYILLLRTIPVLCFDDCRAWTVLVQTHKNISGGGGGWTPLIIPQYGLGPRGYSPHSLNVNPALGIRFWFALVAFIGKRWPRFRLVLVQAAFIVPVSAGKEQSANSGLIDKLMVSFRQQKPKFT